jgi:hypothetical protein
MPNVPLPYQYSTTEAESLVDIRAQERDTQITDIINSLRVVTSSDEISEDQTDDNPFNLSAQTFAGNVQVVASYAPSTAPGPVFGNSTLTAVL